MLILPFRRTEATMSEFPDIINTQIINAKWDAFWIDSSGALDALPPRPTVVVSTPFEPAGAEEIQLRKMLQACQLSDEDYNIIKLTDETVVAWHLIRDTLKVKNVILLGVTPERLGVSVQFMPHQVSRFNECNWIATSSLQELMQQQEIKGHVWKYGLKPVFVDKVYG